MKRDSGAAAREVPTAQTRTAIAADRIRVTVIAPLPPRPARAGRDRRLLVWVRACCAVRSVRGGRAGPPRRTHPGLPATEGLRVPAFPPPPREPAGQADLAHSQT